MICKQCNGVGKIKKYRKKLNGSVILVDVRCKACIGTGVKVEKKRKKSDLHNDLWLWFSKFVRLSDADYNTGQVKCYTCNNTLPILEMGKKSWKLNSSIHAGHFFHSKLDFDRRNIHSQCNSCNTFKSGAHNEYAIHLELDYGSGILQELKTLSVNYSETRKREYTEEFYLGNIEYYKLRVTALKQHFIELFENNFSGDHNE